jgi:ADP-heptose:LPS heptosyltransferase
MAGRYLLLQLKRVGDVLLCTPLVRAIREQEPSARILFLTEEANEPVLRGNPRCDAILTIPPRMGIGEWRALRERLRTEAPATAIDFSGTPRSCIITALSGAPVRVGFRVRAPRRWLYNKVVVPNLNAYTVERRLDLLRALGIRERGLATEIYLDEKDRSEAERILAETGFAPRTPIVAIAPTSRRDAKRWAAEGFARAAALARETIRGEILILCGPGEEEQAEEVRRRIPSARMPERPPPLRTAAAMIERARILIANDGGLKHVAVALGVPTVTIFVSTGPAGWHPPGDARHVAIVAGGDLEREIGEAREAILRVGAFAERP